MAERLALYDYQALGRLLRPRLEADGRGWRACAAEIGVTAPDLSRISSGQPVSAAKVFAVCDWLKVSARDFYSPRGARGQPADMFHGKSTETEGATP